MAIALVAMVGLNSCSKDCDHDFIEHDFTQDIVGTWTSFDGELAEAMVINPDGSFTTTGVMKGGNLYEEKGTIKVVNNKVSLVFEGDKDVIEGRLELVAGKSLSIVLFDDNDVRLTYDYCENDLSDEIIGMWVCTQLPIGKEGDMLIHTFQKDGKLILTGRIPETDDYVVAGESNYMVFGDLYISYGKEEEKALIFKFNVAPNASELGDMMTVTGFMPTENGIVEETSTWLRVKQHLELPGMKYDYIKTFVTNVKGEDKDIPFLNTSFNFAKMDGSIIDKFLKSILFTVEFPEANKIKYSYLLEGKNIVIDAPIEVDGNKMTIKMSANNPAYQDVDMYAFQDQDNTQMHWYMPTTSFEKFFGNTSVALMLGYGQLDKDDTEGIANVYKTIADAVESINLSIVMSQSK
mgnify:CR=1 FL=1